MTWLQHGLLTAPLWAVAIALLVTMGAAASAGAWVKRRVAAETPGDNDRQEGFIISSVFGLLALLTGFTFTMAVERYDGRRAAVLAEANAIGTAYLRTQLLAAPDRQRMSGVITAYVANRNRLAREGRADPGLLARNDALLDRLWQGTMAAYPAIEGRPFSAAYLASINEVIDMDTVRKTGRGAHVPPAIIAALFLYLVVSCAVMGYVLIGRRGRLNAAFLFVLFGMSLMLIIDIERPTDGAIVEPQDAMTELERYLASHPSQRFDNPLPTGSPIAK